MKVTPVAAPQTAQTQPSNSAQDARSRAIAMLSGNAGQAQAAVPNQNNIQPEERGALQTTETRQAASDVESEVETTTQAPEKVEDPAVTARFAALARQEKAIRQREAQIKAKEAEMKAQEQKYLQTPKQPDLDLSKYISKDDFAKDPLSALAQVGISYEQLTEQLISQPSLDPRTEAMVAKLEAKIKALEEGVETTKKSYTDNQTAQYQAAVKQIEQDVKSLVATDPSYEAIKTAGAHKDVVELITQTFEKDGYLMTVEEAAQAVEDHLIEEGLKWTKIDKIKKRLADASAAQKPVTSPKQDGVESQSNKQPQMKTLTNNTASSRQLSARERALLAFEGKLK